MYLFEIYCREGFISQCVVLEIAIGLVVTGEVG